MKKNYFYALIGAIALTGAAGLVSCTDSEDVGGGVNPEFNQQQSEVFADFVFNVSLGNGSTRMSAANTQASGLNFRGITNASVLTFYQGTYAQVQKEDASGNKLYWTSEDVSSRTETTEVTSWPVMIDGAAEPTDGRWISSPTTATRLYDLNALLAENDLKPGSNNEGDIKSRRVVQVSLPTFTNTIMFYGKAVRKSTQTDEEVGKTDMVVNEDLTQTKMSAVVRIEAHTEASDLMHAQENLISFVLKRFVHMGLKKEGDGSSRVEGRWDKTANDGEGAQFANEEDYDLRNRDLRYMEWVQTPEKWVSGTGLVALDLDESHANNDIDLEIEYRNRALSNTTAIDPNSDLGKTGVVEQATFTYTYNDGTNNQNKSYTLNIYKPITWADYGAATKSPLDGTSNLKPLEEILKNAYNKYTEIKADEFRAGSGDAVASVINDIYVIYSNVSQANPTTKPEIIAKFFAERMMRRFSAYFSGTPLKFKNTKDVYDELIKHIDITNETLDAGDKLSDGQVNSIVALSNSNLQIRDFPENQNLPDGSARLLHDNQYNVFYYDSETIPAGDIGTNSASIHDYIYPAELMYFGNSGLRVSDGTFNVSQYPDGTTNWMTDDVWSTLTDSNDKGWTRCDHVKSSTRAVAMQNNINYGTALLKTSVKYGVDKMKDNNAALNPGETSNEILSSTNPFVLTGILVGGQPDQVGWDYLPIKSGSANLKCLLYDKDMPEESNDYGKYLPITRADEDSRYTYTLVYDNYDRSVETDAQNPVYVALEFLNTKEDFWGMHNLVREGGKFYIIGKLDPTTKMYTGGTDNITWPTIPTLPTEQVSQPATGENDYALPPYYVDETTTPVTGNTPPEAGTPMKAHRVFIQDYMTEAVFSLGETSLQKAYLTVPDLRSAQISLGLSVDLNWREGLKFDDVELGK